MVIRECNDEWKTPVLTQELLDKTIEEEVGQGETQPLEIQVPKR
jgi:hypothetical protein